MTAFWLGDHEVTRDISAALAADCRRHGMVGWLAGALQGVVVAQIVLGEWPGGPGQRAGRPEAGA